MGKNAGPLAFLNKKGWHPSAPRNLEKVWKKEQEAAKEQAKLEELRKQYEDERKADEFGEIAAQAGYAKQERLDWMYGGSMAAAARADAGAQAPAVSAPPAGQGGAELSRAERSVALPSLYSTATPAGQNEMWNRMNADPLLAIKKQEAAAIKRIKENPVRMDEILQEVRKLKESSGSGKHRKEKRQKKEKERRKRSPSRSRSRERKRSNGDPALRRPSKRSISRSPSPPSKAHRRGADGAAGGAAERRRRSEPSPERHVRGGPTDAGTSGRGEPDHGRHRQGSGTDRQHISGGRGLDWNRDDHGHGRAEGRRGHDGEGHPHSRPDTQDHASGPSLAHGVHRPEAREGVGQRGARGVDGVRVYHDAASVGTSGRYGLELNKQGGSTYVASARAVETRARLEAAAQRKEAEERDKAAHRYVRKEYKTGRMTEEERQARLAEMMSNAAQHDAARHSRLRSAAAADEAEAKQAPSARGSDASKAAATAEVYAKLAGGGGSGHTSLESRIASRKFYSER